MGSPRWGLSVLQGVSEGHHNQAPQKPKTPGRETSRSARGWLMASCRHSELSTWDSPQHAGNTSRARDRRHRGPRRSAHELESLLLSTGCLLTPEDAPPQPSPKDPRAQRQEPSHRASGSGWRINSIVHSRQKAETTQGSTAEGWVNYMGSIPTGEQGSAMKTTKGLTPASPWMDLEGMMV